MRPAKLVPREDANVVWTFGRNQRRPRFKLTRSSAVRTTGEALLRPSATRSNEDEGCAPSVAALTPSAEGESRPETILAPRPINSFAKMPRLSPLSRPKIVFRRSPKVKSKIKSFQTRLTAEREPHASSAGGAHIKAAPPPPT